MVEAKERQAEAGQADSYYSPSRIADWLGRWSELVEMAQQTHGSTSRIDPTPGRPRGSYIVPPSFRLANVLADIETAWNALGPETDGYKLVYLVMQGYPTPAAADLLRIHRPVAYGIYWDAVREMARHLGWRPTDE
jgi:hypothetical protein